MEDYINTFIKSAAKMDGKEASRKKNSKFYTEIKDKDIFHV
jgi:hypothetical protein